MLKKLLKYEFKAMGKTLLPLFGAAILLAIFSAISGRLFVSDDTVIDLNILKIIAMLLILAFIIFIIATLILSLIISILRFKNSLLGTEGYLSNVLPVTPGQHVIAKTITSCVYEILGIITAFAAIMIFACISSGGFDINWSELFSEIGKLFSSYGGRIAALSIEVILLFLVSLAGLNLMMYASLAVGHSFNGKKLLKSILVFVGFYFITQIINACLLNLAAFLNISLYIQSSIIAYTHLLFISLIVLQSFYAALYYIVTCRFIGSELNLE